MPTEVISWEGDGTGYKELKSTSVSELLEYFTKETHPFITLLK